MNVTNRPGLDLIICIDISRSMTGTKLKKVKETLIFMLEQLDQGDRVALISFDDNTEVLAELNPISQDNREDYVHIIKSLKTRGNTNLLKAIDKCLELVER